MAKIAVESDRVPSEAAEGLSSRTLAQGDGWQVRDVICTAGPGDRSFAEKHETVNIALVISGSFQYSSGHQRALMSPGAIMLGNRGQCFECGHEHGAGDRCLSFSYDAEYFANLTSGAGDFLTLRLPPLRSLSAVVAQSSAALAEPMQARWDELSVQMAVQSASVSSRGPVDSLPLSAEARTTRAIRLIEQNTQTELPLSVLAREARLSQYHFLRIFERVTGLTPHQYVIRTRLRAAAKRLLDRRVPEPKILDIALDSGFGDVSNFNRAFRSEFEMGPRAFRAQAAR